jgi:hypothetical protein
MKRVIAFVLVIVLCASLCACGAKKPHGTYTLYIDKYKFATYDFSMFGNKVTVEYINSGEAKVATWEMEGNTVKLSFEGGTYDEFTYDPETDTLDLYGVATARKD